MLFDCIVDSMVDCREALGERASKSHVRMEVTLANPAAPSETYPVSRGIDFTEECCGKVQHPLGKQSGSQSVTGCSTAKPEAITAMRSFK